jgi:hypothetical protein
MRRRIAYSMPECRGLPDSLTRRGKDCGGRGMRGNFQEGG